MRSEVSSVRKNPNGIIKMPKYLKAAKHNILNDHRNV